VKLRTSLAILAVLVGAASLPACGAAVAAGAGAASAIYLTSRGAKSLLQGSVADLMRRTQAVFQSEGIALTGQSTEKAGAKGELKGTKGDLDISVTFESQSATTTDVEASARKNAVEWDKDYAKNLLSKIAQQP
jgi:hypothetical protein